MASIKRNDKDGWKRGAKNDSKNYLKASVEGYRVAKAVHDDATGWKRGEKNDSVHHEKIKEAYKGGDIDGGGSPKEVDVDGADRNYAGGQKLPKK